MSIGGEIILRFAVSQHGHYPWKGVGVLSVWISEDNVRIVFNKESYPYVSMKMPRPLNLSTKVQNKNKPGTLITPFEQKTGPSTALSVVNHMAIPSPYKWDALPDILNSISICQFAAVNGKRDHSQPH
jgi:hypothetical protein